MDAEELIDLDDVGTEADRSGREGPLVASEASLVDDTLQIAAALPLKQGSSAIVRT
jgi:hypothetical protein